MPRGIAIKYHLPGGGDTDMVTNSFKFFPVGTGEDFRDLLQAIVASPADAPKPTKLEQFFASHPNAPRAIGSLPIPDSFADEEYHGIDAFIFVNKSGLRQAVRYLVVPEKLVHITPEEAAKQPPNYLFDDLAERIARRPVVFHLKAQLAEPGDQTKDASQAWPDDRKVVDLGVLTLTKVVPNSSEAEKKLLFQPTNLIAGIELSDDLLPSVRGDLLKKLGRLSEARTEFERAAALTRNAREQALQHGILPDGSSSLMAAWKRILWRQAHESCQGFPAWRGDAPATWAAVCGVRPLRRRPG
jgi:catalase